MNRRLYRSRRDSVLGGVCGGVAEYLDVDPSIVRIIWVALAVVTGGLFLLLYIVMWIVVPETPPGFAAPQPPPGGYQGGTPSAAPQGTTEASPAASAPYWEGTEQRLRRAGSGGAVVFGLILIALGAWFLVDQYLPAFDRDLIWPIALVVLGAVLLVVSLRRRT
jgi:phage shock protein PspC (stress-responsive transcriptional regulator)